MATYAKVFATVGVGVALSERQHLALLAIAVSGSVLASAYRTWRARRAWPVVVAVSGCALLVGGHLASARELEWVGMVTLVVGGILERRAAGRGRRADAAGALARA